MNYDREHWLQFLTGELERILTDPVATSHERRQARKLLGLVRGARQPPDRDDKTGGSAR